MPSNHSQALQIFAFLSNRKKHLRVLTSGVLRHVAW